MDDIYIIVASDDHYAILLCALVKSIETNHKTSENIHIVVIDDGISLKNKNKINKSILSDKISLKWIASKNAIPAGIVLPLDKTGFPLTAYLRIFAPYVIPDNAKKVIYLDVDVIVMNDISNLWNIDLEGNLMGAIQDYAQKTVNCSWGGIPNYKDLGIPEDTKYFNSGVLLIEAHKWRNEKISEKVIKALHDNINYVNYADQYGLNVVLYNQWKELDPKWNNVAFNEIENPNIIHFLDIKPIFSNYKSSEKYRNIFYRYLNETEFKGFKPLNGRKIMLKKIHTRIKKFLLKYINSINLYILSTLLCILFLKFHY